MQNYARDKHFSVHLFTNYPEERCGLREWGVGTGSVFTFKTSCLKFKQIEKWC